MSYDFYEDVAELALVFLNSTVILCQCVHMLSIEYSLDANRITDSGAGTLANALKVNKLLENLR